MDEALVKYEVTLPDRLKTEEDFEVDDGRRLDDEVCCSENTTDL